MTNLDGIWFASVHGHAHTKSLEQQNLLRHEGGRVLLLGIGVIQQLLRPGQQKQLVLNIKCP